MCERDYYQSVINEAKGRVVALYRSLLTESAMAIDEACNFWSSLDEDQQKTMVEIAYLQLTWARRSNRLKKYRQKQIELDNGWSSESDWQYLDNREKVFTLERVLNDKFFSYKQVWGQPKWLIMGDLFAVGKMEERKNKVEPVMMFRQALNDSFGHHGEEALLEISSDHEAVSGISFLVKRTPSPKITKIYKMGVFYEALYINWITSLNYATVFVPDNLISSVSRLQTALIKTGIVATKQRDAWD